MNFKLIVLKMESCCSFKALVGGVCGYDSKDRKRDSKIVPLLSCDKDINCHKSLYKFTGPEDDVELILSRAAKFTKSKSLSSMTICPNHRSKLGIGWSRGSSTRCRVPEDISYYGKEKGVWPKGERGLGNKESEVILQKTGTNEPQGYIFQRPLLRGLFLEGHIFGGAYLRREICVSKSIGLAL